MMDLKKLDGPFGIPVFHQQMPEMVNAVSLGWSIFTGAGDDAAFGAPGLHHWLEHVPFKGTKRYSAGADKIRGPFIPYNGNINARTNLVTTSYFGTVHKHQWREALSVITDLVSNPLLADESIYAERRVIHQEISEHLGSADGVAAYNLPGILYPGHPFSYPVLGSETSLAAIEPDTLRMAHRLGYDRSRAIFTCVGNISDIDLLEALSRAAVDLPDHNLSERRRPANFGPLPIWKPGKTEIETEFAASVIYMLFPITQNDGSTVAMTRAVRMCHLLNMVFGYGKAISPLMSTVRGRRQLVYGCSPCWRVFSGGGYFGFQAQAKKENSQAIVDAFYDVLNDSSLRSTERLGGMKSSSKAIIEMMPINPPDFREKAISQYINCGGEMISSKANIDWFNGLTIADIDVALTGLRPENARIIIFKGMGKT